MSQPQVGTQTSIQRWMLIAIIALVMMTVTPALAAPSEIQAFCFEKALKAMLPFRRGAGEAFMANCIADLTPTPPRKRRPRK
jgi:hypothetical protein